MPPKSVMNLRRLIVSIKLPNRSTPRKYCLFDYLIGALVVSRHRPTDSLEIELIHQLYAHDLINSEQNTGAVEG